MRFPPLASFFLEPPTKWLPKTRNNLYLKNQTIEINYQALPMILNTISSNCRLLVVQNFSVNIYRV